VPDATESDTIPDPSEQPADEDTATDDRVHVETAYARRAGSPADIDGTHHHAAAPGEGEGTGIGESGG
jgi:hypothetical protein